MKFWVVASFVCLNGHGGKSGKMIEGKIMGSERGNFMELILLIFDWVSNEHFEQGVQLRLGVFA